MGTPNGEKSDSVASSKDDHKEMSKEDLWKDALEKEVDGGVVVQMVGMDSPSHIVYARVATGSNVTIGTVVESMVEEGWRNVAKGILEKKEHVQIDSYPSASQLLHLGSVWLLNETAYTQGKGAHAHRLGPKDEARVPDWQDMTLRVHYVPDRFHAANEVDWSKYCRGLLIGQTVEVAIDGSTPHVPVLEGLPDVKEGVIVYEDADLGFAVLDKPGNMPVHSTLSNHAENVVSMYTESLKLREKDAQHKKIHVTVPQRLDTSPDLETHGLIAVATKADLASYVAKLPEDAIAEKYRCLVCVKDPDKMDMLESMQKSGAIMTHYMDHKSPAPKRFVRNKPQKPGRAEWVECQLRITKVGDENFRAACVRSVYKDSIDASLAHRLWGPDSSTPAEDLGVQYVMQLEVEPVGTAKKYQIRGQLAALGFPVVGDVLDGGGKCEFHSHKHVWNRMAMQCCELSFIEPKWEESGEGGKKELVPTERKCVFRLNEAWWSEYLKQYELFYQGS